jgi:hypothetical protein
MQSKERGVTQVEAVGVFRPALEQYRTADTVRQAPMMKAGNDD